VTKFSVCGIIGLRPLGGRAPGAPPGSASATCMTGGCMPGVDGVVTLGQDQRSALHREVALTETATQPHITVRSCKENTNFVNSI